jgi:hypothetical protein
MGAVATACFKLAQAEHPRLKVVDQMGLLNLLQGVSCVCNPPPGAAGKAICAAGRTLTEEWAATQQYGRARLTRGTGLAT